MKYKIGDCVKIPTLYGEEIFQITGLSIVNDEGVQCYYVRKNNVSLNSFHPCYFILVPAYNTPLGKVIYGKV